MVYQRKDIYPDGTPIPSVLPPSYQPAAYGEAPSGQMCYTCAAYRIADKTCTKWGATVKPKWWCAAWTQPKLMKAGEQEVKLYKRISTTSVEEHFNGAPVPQLPKPTYNGYDYVMENEEDTIKVNVPLLIRLLEWAREDVSKDVELHVAVERMVEMSEYGDTLEMEAYPAIIAEPEDKGESQPQGPRFRG